MSPRTTIILVILLLIGGGAAWWLSRSEPPRGAEDRRILPGLVTSDVREIRIESPSAGRKPVETLVLKRGEDARWSVSAAGGVAGSFRPARGAAVDRLLETLREVSAIRPLSAAKSDEPGRYGLAAGQGTTATLTLRDGRTRSIAFGSDLTEQSLAVLADGHWPPWEVDRQIRAECTTPADSWVEHRLLVFEPPSARVVRITSTDPAVHSVTIAKESSTWLIREPELARADQVRVDRLVATLASLEGMGSWSRLGTESAPVARLKVEVETASGMAPIQLEIGARGRDDRVPARSAQDPTWVTIQPGILDLIGDGPATLRSRHFVTSEAAKLRRVVLTRGAETLIEIERPGTGPLFFRPPESWKWTQFEDRRVTMMLDPTAQNAFLEALGALEVDSFGDAQAQAPAELTLLVTEAGTGERGVERRIEFTADQGGMRGVSIDGGRSRARIKSSAIVFLQRPYYELLARQVSNTAWFSIVEVEISEGDQRHATLLATPGPAGKPVWKLRSRADPTLRDVPKEVVDPVLAKLSMLTVKRFVHHGVLAEHGLDHPRYTVRWRDSQQRREDSIDLRAPSQWFTWRVGARDGAADDFGDTDMHPGLVFQTESQDLDVLLNVLNLR